MPGTLLRYGASTSCEPSRSGLAPSLRPEADQRSASGRFASVEALKDHDALLDCDYITHLTHLQFKNSFLHRRQHLPRPEKTQIAAITSVRRLGESDRELGEVLSAVQALEDVSPL